MRKKLLAKLFLILICKIFGQTPTSRDYLQYYFKNLPNSPSTATFLKYGDIQNSEFIGANSAKIPLYSFKEGTIDLPLTLDYISGNGIKVTDEASSVGLGWNIGLPTITQSVMGYDDFDINENHPNLKIDLHYQSAPWPTLNYNGKYLESKEMPEPSGYIEAAQKGKYAYYYSSHYCLPVNGSFKLFPNWVQYDTSPDIFILNLFGDKVEFIIENHKDLDNPGYNPQFISLNKHGYKISYDNLALFKITAPNGFIYEFGKKENVSMAGVISRNYVLTKITDINNNYVTLSYDEYQNVSNFTPFSKNLNYTYWSRADPPIKQCGGIPVYYGGQYSLASRYNTSPNFSGITFPYSGGQAGTFTVPSVSGYQSTQNYLLINGIKSSSSSIKFIYTDREDFPTKKLSSINIFSSDENKIVRSVNFIYDYFNSPDNIYPNATTTYTANRLKKRLKLTSLNFNQIEQYRFDYYEKYQLPAKDSFATDYWGYPNGGINNKTYFLNPNDFDFGAYNVPVNDNYNNNKKIADVGYCTSGLLSRIIYPTKGYSVFEYELNSADNLFQTIWNPKPTQGKGLRFKRQSNYDINNKIVGKTEYIYEGGISTNPLDLIKRYNYRYFDATSESLVSLISMNSTNNYSSSPLSSGDYIGYSKVIKTEFDKDY